MLERDFQARLIKRLKNEFPDCFVLKNDPNYIQGIPDLTVLWHQRWAMIEVKKSEVARLRPNQRYYMLRAKDLSFGFIVYPENEEDLFEELHNYFD